SFWPQQCLVHFGAKAYLAGADGIRGDGLIDVRKPCQAGRCSARTGLGYALRLQRTRGFQDYLIDVSDCGDGIVWRFVVMLRVVAGGDGVGEIKLVPIEVPVANELLGELLIVLLHFGNSGA